MESSCWIEGEYGKKYRFRIVKVFGIFTEKGIVG